MKTTDWAEKECRIACKKENPDYDFDSNEFDYGCCCYKSALKAYKSLCEDNHSGASFSFTKDILIRLMDGQPLTPITDNDFPKVEYDPEDEWLKRRQLKSSIQCPRMSSLFREETLDGNVSYHDIDRAYYINIEDPSDTYMTWTGFIDDMFPITMPYMPETGKYKIYAQSFLTDKNKGDFDTRGILYVITPSGEKVDVGIYQHEEDSHKWVDITKEEYETLLSQRIDEISAKVARKLIWTLVSNSGSKDEIELKERGFKAMDEIYKDFMFTTLTSECKFFDNPDNWQYNTFHVRQALVNGETEEFKDITELVSISRFLQIQKKTIRALGFENL